MCSWITLVSAGRPSARHRARDQPFRLLELFPQNYHEPYYMSYTNEDFSALAISSGLTHIRDVKVFVSKVMVFDKPARAHFCPQRYRYQPDRPHALGTSLSPTIRFRSTRRGQVTNVLL